VKLQDIDNANSINPGCPEPRSCGTLVHISAPETIKESGMSFDVLLLYVGAPIALLIFAVLSFFISGDGDES